jgi:hypothetical protein
VETFELLLRIKESVGEETFRDALAHLNCSAPPPTPHPEGLVRVEQANRRTKLPHTFVCKHKHEHSITSLSDLLNRYQPRCLLERIMTEWACFDEVDDA